MKTFKIRLLKLINRKNPKHDQGITVLTGGNLDFTKRFIKKMNKEENKEILILYSNFDNLKDRFYTELENELNTNNPSNPSKIQVFNCNLSIQEDKEEFLLYLENNNKKISKFLHLDHFVCCSDNTILPNYKELKKMNEINIEIPMLLNSDLIKRERMLINSKIIHLQIRNSSNNHIELRNPIGFENEKDNKFYSHETVFKWGFKHMIGCLVPLLKENPVFFGLIDFHTLDKEYLDRFEENQSITHKELNEYRKNYLDTIDLIDYVSSDKLDPLDMGKKIWSLSDLKI